MGVKYTAKDVYDELKASYSIPGSFSRWEEYRKQVTDYIIANTEPGKSIAIIGVGEANDLDLGRLYEHCGNLTLYDINTKSMEIAVEKYNLKNLPYVTCIQCDLYGITENEYIGLIDIVVKDINRLKKMGKKWSPFISLQKFRSELNRIYDRINKLPIIISSEKTDYSVMIGVHSQLNAFTERIWTFFMEVAKASRAMTCGNQDIYKITHGENDVYIPKVNDALLQFTRERSFVGLERFEYGRNVAVQGAGQALDDFDRLMRAGKIIVNSKMQAIWPLREGVSYEMVIIKIDKVVEKCSDSIAAGEVLETGTVEKTKEKKRCHMKILKEKMNQILWTSFRSRGKDKEAI